MSSCIRSMETELYVFLFFISLIASLLEFCKIYNVHRSSTRALGVGGGGGVGGGRGTWNWMHLKSFPCFAMCILTVHDI